MENKSFIELELIGIVGMYREDSTLFVITRDGNVWQYYPGNTKFTHHSKLP